MTLGTPRRAAGVLVARGACGGALELARPLTGGRAEGWLVFMVCTLLSLVPV